MIHISLWETSLLATLIKKNSDLVFDIFNQLADEFKQTLLIVTHDPSFAERTHRIIKMEDGKIIS